MTFDLQIHGDNTIGRQGIGVNTPKCDIVAAITTGFIRDLHMPKVGIFKGVVSRIVPTVVKAETLCGVAINGHGVNPNLHSIKEPVFTTIAKSSLLSL